MGHEYAPPSGPSGSKGRSHFLGGGTWDAPWGVVVPPRCFSKPRQNLINMRRGPLSVPPRNASLCLHRLGIPTKKVALHYAFWTFLMEGGQPPSLLEDNDSLNGFLPPSCDQMGGYPPYPPFLSLPRTFLIKYYVLIFPYPILLLKDRKYY